MAWTAAKIPDQSGAVAVVTGGNGGLGLGLGLVADVAVAPGVNRPNS
jgi:NAD(P)-dependent dehydrogenase (short-subunit alcohol dehydrogenase family)